MAATTPPLTSLVETLERDYPALSFVASDDFYWSPDNHAVHYRRDSSVRGRLSLLHELAHAHLDHHSFSTAITLLDMERAAWHVVATEFAPRYAPDITSTVVQQASEAELDYYRDWLHQRSICPHCDAVGIEITPQTYQCLTCHRHWRVNDARTCALRRYKQTTP